MYKENLALNNLKWLMCHKTKPNQINMVGCRLFNAKSCLYIYIKYIIFK